MTRGNALPRRVFVDTSALVALASRREGVHDQARAIDRSLRQARAELICTNLIVAETHGLVLGRAGRLTALRMLRNFDADPFVVLRVDEEDEAAARQIIESYTDKDFSLVDATSFVVMGSLGLRTAFAFDDHFRQYGFETL